MNRIGPELFSERPTVVAFGGGKGGAGRSTLCAEVARSVARHDQRVLCVDASWSCPTLNVLLHATEPRFDLRGPDAIPIGDADSHVADFIVETNNDQTWLMSIAAGRNFPYVRPRLGADAILSQLHDLDFDWVLIDLPAGLDPFHVGLFTLSDVPILICTPEPASVRLSTQYLRSAFYQAIGYHPDARGAREAILDMLYDQPLNMSLDSLLESADRNEIAHDVVVDTGRRFEPYLAVNLVREGAERDLGNVLCHAWYEELSIFPRMLASVDYEDRRWFYNRRTTGTGNSRGDEAFSRDTEEIARKLLDISLLDAKFPRPIPENDDVHPSIKLGISPEAGQNEVRQHCRRLWEGYRRENTIELVFGDPDRRMEIADELEHMYRKVLTMPTDSFQAAPSPEEQAEARRHSSPASSRPTSSANQQSASSASKSRVPASTTPSDGSGSDGSGSDASASDESSGDPPEVTSSGDDGSSAGDESSSSAAETHERELGEVEPLARETLVQIGEKADSAGELVTNIRRSRDMSLQELSQRTHIGIKYLSAIEKVDLDSLPRGVYLRGYLREIARIFDIEPETLIERYFEYLDEEA